MWIELIGAFLMGSGIIGLIVVFFFLPENPICPVCQEAELMDGENMCPGCKSFVYSLSYCELHDIMHDGADCPKCLYGYFAKKR